MDWVKFFGQLAANAPKLVPTLLRALADHLEQHPEVLEQLLAGLFPKPARE